MSNAPSSAGFSGRGYLILYQDGTVRSFGNAPSFSFPANSGIACAIAVQPNGTGLAGVCQDGSLLYAGTAPNIASSLTHNNNFIDIVYAPDGNGLWGLDIDCGVWHAGSASSIGYGGSNGDCIRLAMYASDAGVVIDKNGHLYKVNTSHDGGSQIHFNNGAIGGGYFPPFSGSDKDQFVLATDQTTVNKVSSISTSWDGEVWANLDDGYYPSLPGTADVQNDLSSGTLLHEFDIIDIASTPSGNGYWLLVSFRSALNTFPQYTVIAAGDARPAGGTQLGTVAPFGMTNDPVNAVRIIAMPPQSWTDLYLDTIALPALYQSQLSTFSADFQFGQATGFFDMGYRYALYTPEWVVENPQAPTGLKLVIPLEYLSLLSTNDYISISLDLGYAYDSTTQSYTWSLTDGNYQQWQGSSAVSAKEISKVLGVIEDLTESLEEVLVEMEIVSEGTLTPVVVALEVLIVAADLYEWGSKYFGLLSDSGAVNFPSVAAHAVVRTVSCLQPLSGPTLDPITSISDSDGNDDNPFIDALATLVKANPIVYGTSINDDPNYNAWQYTLTVGNDGSLNAPSCKSVEFRVVQPEQSIAHNNGGCVVSTLITINETAQFDAQCALLCHFAKVQGTTPSGESTQPLSLVAVSGGIAWVSVLGDGTVTTSITPCILGSSNPANTSQTLNTTQDIMNAVYSLISAGAQGQSNCPTDVGEGLGNFAVQSVQAFINSLGAVGATS